MKNLLLLILLAAPLAAQTRNVNLKCQHVSTGVEFNIYRAPATGPGACEAATAFVKLNSAPLAECAYTDPAPYGVFCYEATATAAGLESARSNRAEAQVAPPPPTGLDADIDLALTFSGKLTARLTLRSGEDK